MNLAKVSANGQVTIPIEIRKKLHLNAGDKLVFQELENGVVAIDNAAQGRKKKPTGEARGLFRKLATPEMLKAMENKEKNISEGSAWEREAAKEYRLEIERGAWESNDAKKTAEKMRKKYAVR